MRFYHIFFLILKILISVQFFLIITNVQSITSKTYLITEIVFKTTLALFIQYFLYTKIIDGLPLEDKAIFGFAGALLLFDALVNDLPFLLKQYDIDVKVPHK
jgi:hypothetical protein